MQQHHSGPGLQLICSLYVIEFPNGKRYFGITSRSPEERWRDHLKASRRYNRRICRAIRKHGGYLRVLVRGPVNYIKDLEVKAIAAFKTDDWRHGYNSAPGGDFNPMEGRKHTPEALAKIAKASRERIWSAKTNKKRSLALKGVHHSDERRANVSAATKAAMADPALRERLSTAARGRIPWNKGLRFS